MDDTANNSPLTLRCPAKLNLTLAVGAPREDGLHPIASVMVVLDFGDTLRLEPCSKPASTFKRTWATDAPMPHPIDWPIEQDLVYRAHACIEKAAGRRLPIHCDLIKQVPAGAGMGGGSSNAAAMLAGMRKLFSLDISNDALAKIAGKLGADVVFSLRALLGQPAALVTGIGDVIKPLNRIPPFDCVLVFPDGQCPTSAVYRAFDQLNSDASIPDHLVEEWRNSSDLPASRNDLTETAIRVCPGISSAMGAIKSQKLEPRLTGSGSAVFAIVKSKVEAVGIAESINQLGFVASTARFSNFPSRV